MLNEELSVAHGGDISDAGVEDAINRLSKGVLRIEVYRVVRPDGKTAKRRTFELISRWQETSKEHCFIFNAVGESSSWRGRRNATERSETEEVSCPISGFHLCSLCFRGRGVEKINEVMGHCANFSPNDRLREDEECMGLGCTNPQ